MRIIDPRESAIRANEPSQPGTKLRLFIVEMALLAAGSNITLVKESFIIRVYVRGGTRTTELRSFETITDRDCCYKATVDKVEELI